MVNIWDYANELPYVKLTTTTGKIFVGEIISVIEAEEVDWPEDSLTLQMGSSDLEVFLQSQIASIEVQKRPR